jgi:hypothetical protein
MKIRPLGAEFYVEGKTNRYDEANSNFMQFFLDSPNNWFIVLIQRPGTLNGIPKFDFAGLNFNS